MQSTPRRGCLASPGISGYEYKDERNRLEKRERRREARPVWMLVASPVVVAVGASAIGDAVVLDPIRLTAGSADVLTISAATSSVLP